MHDTVSVSLPVSSLANWKDPGNLRSSSLMVRKDQAVSQHHVLPPSRSKHYDLGNISSSKRFYPFVHFVGFGFVAGEADNAEFGLDLAGVDLDDADARGDEFAAKGVGESADGGFGCAVLRPCVSMCIVGCTNVCCRRGNGVAQQDGRLTMDPPGYPSRAKDVSNAVSE